MAVLKCKMCGGTIEFEQGATVGVCDSCGTKQTLPKTDDDVIANLFNRANNLRLKCEFDKAAQIYEKIVEQDDSEAEAHWGIVLCKYGIEYVEDPKTFQRIPTCHRTLFQAVTTDADYLAAIDYSDVLQQQIYESEARAIDKIQKDILAIVENEQPFDVFICYKETDESGKRTVDSAIANDIYHQLTQEGFKVFYAAITLEDKLGQEYEPYIFAALNSAKVMLVLGTRPEYFSAVWVRNEWARYLQLMKTDRSKLLIPCYRDMDAYDLPEEFAHLQAQDMSKIGFINDVVRGIKKVAQTAEPQVAVVKETVVTAAGGAIDPLLKRAFMFLEDGDWTSANEYCEKVLDMDPECATAYLGKLLAEQKVKRQEELRNCRYPFDNSGNYQKVLRFGDEATKTMLTQCVEYIKDRNEKARLEGIYNEAQAMLEQADTEEQCLQAAELFESIRDYKDAAQQVQACHEKVEECRQAAERAKRERKEKAEAEERERKERVEATRKDGVLGTARRRMEIGTRDFYVKAAELLESIPGWRDADKLLAQCKEKLAELDAAAEAARKAKEEARAKARKRNKKLAIIGSVVVAVAVVVSLLLNMVILPLAKYAKAEKLLAAGELQQAALIYGLAGDWKDAAERSLQIWSELPDRGTMLAAAGEGHTVGLKADGTVVAVGRNGDGQYALFGWRDIVAVAAGHEHTVGLKADGTVVAVGRNGYGQCDVSGWTDIVAVSAGVVNTVGLKADGTVVAVGYSGDGRCDVSGWTDIVAVSAGGYHTVGLKADGTVVATGVNGNDQCDVSGWRDIVAVAAGGYHTVGLKSDGTVVAVGHNSYGRCDVSGWTNIVAVSAGYYHTVGLKADGTVVAVGNNENDQCDVSGWQDIVAVAAGNVHTVGLKADGTVVAVGYGGNGQKRVTAWTDIQMPQSK